MPNKKSTLNPTKVKKLKLFNSPEAMQEYLDEAKFKIATHPAKKKTIIGAKNSGKTEIVNANILMMMERDPMASAVACRKTATSASKRLASALSKTKVNLGRNPYKFNFPIPYKKTQSNMYRQKDKRYNFENQSVEYVSFDAPDSLAGIACANGGYIGIVHIEEPSQLSERVDFEMNEEERMLIRKE